MTRRTLTRARVVSAAMQKGGVGKTTAVLNLARAAALRGLRVLVVDLDPQGNTTTSLAKAELAPKQLTIADAILPEEYEPVPIDEVIIPAIWANVDLVPAVLTPLTKAEKLINASDHGREHRLKTALKPALTKYDLILIDNAPALGILLVNALTASDDMFAVVEADEWSCDGLAHLGNTVRRTKEYYNTSLNWSGVLISKWRGTSSDQHWLSTIQEKFPQDRVWEQDKIPLWNSIKTTLSEGKGLDESKEARLRVLARSFRRIVAHWVPDDEVTV